MQVPIPPDGHANPDGKAIQVRPAPPGERWPRKRLIGKVLQGEEYRTEDGIPLMIPNDTYRREYPEEFERYQRRCGAQVPPETISVGLYLLVSGIANRLGIYPLLCEVFSAPLANAVLDLAMYFLLCQDTDLDKMTSQMNQELLFSLRAHDADWYADWFQRCVGEDAPDAACGDLRVCAFLRRWVALRSASGAEEVWIRLDGTPMDRRSDGNGEAQQGHGKTIVLTAIGASGDNRGMPLAYAIIPGSDRAAETAQDLLRLFTGKGWKIRCVVAERGFPCDDLFQLCEALELPFLMVLEEDSEAFVTMFDAFRDAIFWREVYWIEGTTSLYGISRDGVPLCPKDGRSPDRAVCAALFFDGTIGNALWGKYHSELNRALDKLEDQLRMFRKNGKIGEALSHDGADPERGNRTDQEKVLAALAKANITVPDGYQDVIELRYDPEAGAVAADVRRDVLKEKCKTLGYSCIASSVPKTAQEMAEDAMLGDGGEAFRAMRAVLDFPTAHGQKSHCLHGKLFACFVADLIRNEIAQTFQRYEEESGCLIDTDDMIRSFSNIRYTRSGAGYRYAGQPSAAQCEILEGLGIPSDACKALGPLLHAATQAESLEQLAAQRREFPAVPVARGPGRPKGSLNKPKGGGSKEGKPAKRENSKGKGDKAKVHGDSAEVDAEGAKSAASIENGDGIDSRNGTRGIKTAAPAEAGTASRSTDAAGDLATVGLQAAEREACRTAHAKHETEVRSSRETGESKSGDGPQERTNRTGAQYRKTRRQDEYDRDLSEKTGIDIIGNPPPRPWTAAFRAAETRRRNRLRKEAEKRWREICAAQAPEPDQ